MLLDALEEARAQITGIFSALADIAPAERNRLYQDVGIGRHVRHIVDHFNALKNREQTAALVDAGRAAKATRVDAGRAAKATHVDAGRAAKAALTLIDYNQRSRDSDIERDFELGQSVLQSLAHWLAALDPATLNQAVHVRAEISCSHTENGEFQSTLAREILYLINHTIHHAAYTKLLLSREGLQLPAHIGIAPCTASFLRNKAGQ